MVYYRYNFMSHHLFHNLSSQLIDQHDIGIYLWLVFVAEGDCEKFNAKFCVLPNGIVMMWVEYLLFLVVRLMTIILIV